MKKNIKQIALVFLMGAFSIYGSDEGMPTPREDLPRAATNTPVCHPLFDCMGECRKRLDILHDQIIDELTKHQIALKSQQQNALALMKEQESIRERVWARVEAQWKKREADLILDLQIEKGSFAASDEELNRVLTDLVYYTDQNDALEAQVKALKDKTAAQELHTVRYMHIQKALEKKNVQIAKLRTVKHSLTEKLAAANDKLAKAKEELLEFRQSARDLSYMAASAGAETARLRATVVKLKDATTSPLFALKSLKIKKRK